MFINIFRNRKRAGIDTAAYLAEAARMEAIARSLPGFVSYRKYSAEDGEALSVSEWESEDAARAWARHPEHLAAQERGRMEWYESYSSYCCVNPRIHNFERSDD